MPKQRVVAIWTKGGKVAAKRGADDFGKIAAVRKERRGGGPPKITSQLIFQRWAD